MYEFQEFEYILEEAMDAGLGYSLLANSFSSLLGIAAYVLTAIALYTLANRRGIKNAWLSWVPVINCWIIGSLSDQYRYVVRGEVKSKRKVLLTLNIINAVLAVIMAVVAVIMIVGAVQSTVGAYNEEQLGSVIVAVMSILALCLPLAGISVAIAVIHFMAMYDIYNSCSPQNSVVFLVLSIFFSITEPFFLFFTRNKDDGMPPRKRETAYEVIQEPWNNTEYL